MSLTPKLLGLIGGKRLKTSVGRWVSLFPSCPAPASLISCYALNLINPLATMKSNFQLLKQLWVFALFV
jgi:hypothetical protein